MIRLRDYYRGQGLFLRADLKPAFAAIKKVINNYEEQNPRNGCGLLKSNYAPRYYFSRLNAGDQRRALAPASATRPGSFSDSDEQLPEFRIYSYNEIELGERSQLIPRPLQLAG